MRLQTINESIAISSVDQSQAPDNCESCGKPCDDLRPYGKDGTWICLPCGMEDEEETEKNFDKVLDGEKMNGIKVTSIGEAKDTNIAIDFDSTIHSYENGFQENKFDPPVPGAIEAVNKFCQDYKTVYIFTARDILPPVELWMKYQFKEAGLEYPPNLEYTNKKPFADVYIDDKGYKFTGNWDETIQEIEQYKTWMNEQRLSSFTQSYVRGKNS